MFVCFLPLFFSSQVVIPASQTATVTVSYLPSAANATHRATLTFSNPNTGKWTYAVQGTGLEPSACAATVVASPLGSKGQVVVRFRNPRLQASSVVFELLQSSVAEDCKGVLALAGPTR
jgi:hypothetical protein